VSDDVLRRDLAKLVRQLLDESQVDGDNPTAVAIREHLGVDPDELPVHGAEFPSIEHANVQLALDAAFAQPRHAARLFGLSGHYRHYQQITLGDLIGDMGVHVRFGPPEYVHEPVAPDRTLPCLLGALLFGTTPDGPVVVLVHRGDEHGPAPGIRVQVLAADPELAQRFLAQLRRLMDEHDVYRGQVVTIEADRRGQRRAVFLTRPTMNRDELILPAGILERIERHVVGPTEHRAELLASGRHLSRGLLLWGPPGTGKTLTVRYLTGRVTGSTVIILSGASLGLIGAFGALARRLAPTVVVLEDVDFVAAERSFGPFGSTPVLFELMNEMSGVDEDADVAFVLTTNRPDVLEPALAARPGRVDLAVEIPLPDAAERHRLLELYARGLDLDPALLDAVVARTAGMTASFFKELLRRAALAAAAEGHGNVRSEDVTGALDELLQDSATLTRVLLGATPAGAAGDADPRAWMRGVVTAE
jgi:cell division protease FtsH